MSINLYNADCLEAMRAMPNKAFSLAIVDPPYKDDVSGLTMGHSRDFNLATFQAPTKEYFTELFRVSDNQIIWGFNYFLELLPNTDSVITWFKHQNGHFSECEYAWSSVKKSRLFDRSYQKDQYNKIHPTQKPTALYRFLLKHYAKAGDKILDTHLGSGSSAIAAHDMGFDFTGYEIDKTYYDAAKKRYEQHIKQLQLFV